MHKLVSTRSGFHERDDLFRDIEQTAIQSFDQIRAYYKESRLEASVNILEYYPVKERQNLKSSGFKSILFLDRLVIPGALPYRICVRTGIHVVTKDLTELVNYSVIDKKQIIIFEFHGLKVSVEFKREHDYLFILKYCEMAKKLNKEKKKAHGIDPRQSPKHAMGSSKKLTKLRKIARTNSMSIQSLRTKSVFCVKEYARWNDEEFEAWLKHIFVQVKKKVIPLFDSLDKKEMAIMLSAYHDHHRDLDLMEKKITKLDYEFMFSSQKSEKKEGENQQEKMETPRPLTPFEKLLKAKPYVRKQLRDQIIVLREVFHGIFNMNYYYVLKKKISHKKDEVTLNEIERRMLNKERILWDQIECQNQLLVMLLHNEELSTFIRESEMDYEDFQKQEMLGLINEEKEEDFLLLREMKRKQGKKEEEEEEEEEEEREKNEPEVEWTLSEEEEKVLKEQKKKEVLDIYEENLHGGIHEGFDDVSPTLFSLLLDRFEKKYKFRLEKISFKYHLLSIRNIKRKKWESLCRKIRILEYIRIPSIKTFVDAVQEKINAIGDEEMELGERMLLAMDDGADDEEIEKIMKEVEEETKVLQEKKDKLNLEIQDFKLKKIELEMFLKKLKEKRDLIEGKEVINKKEEQQKDEDDEDDDEEEEQKDDDEEEQKKFFSMSGGLFQSYEKLKSIKFSFGEERKEEIRTKLIVEDINRKSSEGNFEIKVKLVLSRFTRSAGASKWQKLAMGMIDPLFSPKFAQFGYLHASVLLKNIGLHWFKNALIYTKELNISDDYDDIVCIDCDCPLICHAQQLVTMIEKLSEEMMYWNSHVEYAPYKIWGKKSEKNCQEFTMAVLNSLDYTPFYPKVNVFLEELKNHVLKYSDDEVRMREIRFFKIDEHFYNKFKVAFRVGGVYCIGFDSGKKFPNHFVFERHDHFDHFASNLFEIEPLFSSRYPEYYQLLKSFDRAFWLKNRKDPNDPMYKPYSKGCPFIKKNVPKEAELQHEGDFLLEG